MVTTLVLVAFLGAEPSVEALTPPPLAASETPQLELTAPAPAPDPDANGRGYLKHGFVLATLGTTFSVAGGVLLGLVVSASARCAAKPTCFNETPFSGLALSVPILTVGLTMLAVAIPLFIKGFRERYPIE